MKYANLCVIVKRDGRILSVVNLNFLSERSDEYLQWEDLFGDRVIHVSKSLKFTNLSDDFGVKSGHIYIYIIYKYIILTFRILWFEKFFLDLMSISIRIS